jgi:hypothetical protein
MNLDDARSLAADLMQQYKLPRERAFGFDRSKARFGKCDYGKKRISLSRHLVEANGIAAVRETISCVVRMFVASYNSFSGNRSLQENRR